MSKLLHLARNEVSHAEATCQEGDRYDNGYLSAWNDAVALIEEHENVELTEEQERIYKSIVKEYKRVRTQCKEDKTGVQFVIGDKMSTRIPDTAFLPALRKFLNEVEK